MGNFPIPRIPRRHWYLKDLDPVVRNPRAEYQTRLDHWRTEHSQQELLHRRLGNARLASAGAIRLDDLPAANARRARIGFTH